MKGGLIFFGLLVFKFLHQKRGIVGGRRVGEVGGSLG